MKSHHIVGFLVLSCLVSCTRDHKEKEIASTLPTSWKAPLPNENESLTTPQVAEETLFTKKCYRWWEVYKNDDLNKLIDNAFSGNFTLKAYFNRIEQVLADSGIVLSDLYPQITAYADAERNRIPKSARVKTTSMTGGTIVPGITPTIQPTFATAKGPSYSNTLNLGLELSYEVDLWGKLSMRYAASKERISESQEDYLAARLSLSASISDYFFRALYYTTQIQLEDKKLNALSELISIEKDRFLSGLVSEDSLLSYEQSREETIAQRENLILLRTETENRLAYLSGILPERFSLPSYAFTFHEPEVPHQISSQVLLNRPDVSALYSSIQASALEVEASEADLLPSLVIGPNFPSLIMGPAVGFRSDKANTLTKWKNHIWSLGASLTYDVFDGGRKKSQVNLNKAIFLENLNTYQDRVLLAIKEIEDSLSSLHEARVTLKNQKNRFWESKEASLLSHSRFIGGLSSKIEYLNSLIDVCTKEEALHQKELAYIQSSISLYSAIGGSVSNS